jgi:6-pyruvoyl-tetrahydropterin synthase related domain
LTLRSTNRYQSSSALPAALTSLFPLPALLIALSTLLVIVPMFFLGNPSGHDFEFHLDSWMEVLGQWKQGILYPHWAAQAHYGFGEARFFFYPPASWALGALLGALLPWAAVPGAFIWIALTAAGLSMFLLARRFLTRNNAIFAAVFYAANPYHWVIVYWRSAYAELLAAWLLPLLLLLILRAEDEGPKMILPLALVVAAAWLTNAPSAVMVNYSLALLVLVVAVARRSPRVVGYGAAAVLLGGALAAFYLIPAAYEEKWVNIAQVLSPGVRPQDNFLFTIMNDPDHNRFNYLVSIVATAEMLVLIPAAFLARKERKDRPWLWWSLAAWASAIMLLMYSFTLVFWEHLPKLRFVQLPWRWLLCFNVAVGSFMALGTRRLITRLVVGLGFAAVLLLVWQHMQPPWWDSADDIAEIRESFRNGVGYEGTDEYVPSGADPYEIKKDAPRAAWQGPGKIQVEEKSWKPQSRLLTVTAREPGRLVLRLFNFPAWKVFVNGHPVSTQTTEETGQMIIPLNPGRSDITILLTRTWDRTLGLAISGLAVIVSVILVWMGNRRWHPSIHQEVFSVRSR